MDCSCLATSAQLSVSLGAARPCFQRVRSKRRPKGPRATKTLRLVKHRLKVPLGGGGGGDIGQQWVENNELLFS